MAFRKQQTENYWLEDPAEFISDPSLKLLIYDGDCNLCNGMIVFFTRRNKRKTVLILSRHTAKAQVLLKKLNPKFQKSDSLIYIKQKQVYFKSSAALLLTREMNGFWSILMFLFIFPQSWRDLIYDFVAKNRFRWFGKNTTCSHPDLL